MKKTIIVYAKVCLDCTDENWQSCRNWLINQKGYVVKFRRTALNPIWHTLATSAYGTSDYPPFAQIAGEGVKTVKELEDEYKKSQEANQPSIQKRTAMSQVRGNTTKKPVRKGRVDRKKTQTKKEA